MMESSEIITTGSKILSHRRIYMTEIEDRTRLIETIQHFRLIDDTYFNNFMDDNFVCMQLMLRIILDDPTLEVQRIQTQREIANIYGRGVRFDVFVRDAAGVEYNVEIQRSEDGAGEERARFNSCLLDSVTIKKGFQWGRDHLPNACVIFITEHDVLGGGKPLYHIWRTIAEMDNKRFDDRASIIYVNAEYQDDSKLGRLMHDMFCENPDDMFYPELAERSRYFKSDKHGVMKMCKAMEKLMEEAREEERNNEKKNTILRLLHKGKKLADMMDATDWTKEQILSFLQSKNLQIVQ